MSESEATSSDKGIPVDRRAPTPTLLQGEVSLPAAVLHESALSHNIEWMQSFARAHHCALAPHGKTSMTPALFRRQIEAGAWGITLATAPQCHAARSGGIKRLLMANQLVGEANMALIADLVRDPEVDFYCLVDSPDNVRDLGRFFGARGLRLQVLVELGMAGARTGCRGREEIRNLLGAVKTEPALVAAGLEGYEGVIRGEHVEAQVWEYAELLTGTALEMDEGGLFEVDRPVITASGSTWYDLIAAAFDQPDIRTRFRALLRPGCYVVHDHAQYERAQQVIRARHPEIGKGLRPTLEIWAHVQSLPEPGLAIAALGKRDVAFDADLPLPLRCYRAANGFGAEALQGWRTTRIMDHHTMLAIPEAARVRVGDVLTFGISHPCLTFDRWRHICLVDDALRVVEVMPTRF